MIRLVHAAFIIASLSVLIYQSDLYIYCRLIFRSTYEACFACQSNDGIWIPYNLGLNGVCKGVIFVTQR